MMKVIVVASNKYINLINGFAHQFNKYWSDTQQVTVICYEKKPIQEIPENFSIHSVGKAEGSYWTNGLIPFFSNLQDQQFVLFLEDHYLISEINTSLWESAKSLVANQQVHKILLSNDSCINWDNYSTDFDIWRKVSKSKCLAPVSLTPSLWNTKVFLEFLKPNFTANDFEQKNISDSIKINMKTLKPKSPICMNVDVFRHGKFNKRIEEINSKNEVKIGGKFYNLSNEDLKVFLNSRNAL